MADRKEKGPHQAKNKPAFSNSFSAITGGSVLNVTDPSSADERKTVILDDDLEGLEFEDRAWLYWKRNKNFIVTLVIVAFVVVFGANLWKIYKKNRDIGIADAYASAVSFEERAAFAAANSGTPAAGVALLANADTLYFEGKFAEASPIYKTAAGDLQDGVLYGRAVLGEAMSLIKAGSLDAGYAALLALSKNPKAGVYSAEAGYHLGVLYSNAGKVEDAKAILQAVEQNPQAGLWAMQANAFLEGI